MQDVNSEFWSNILESQLLVDLSSVAIPAEDRLLAEKMLLYNAHSCLSEFVNLVRCDINSIFVYFF